MQSHCGFTDHGGCTADGNKQTGRRYVPKVKCARGIGCRETETTANLVWCRSHFFPHVSNRWLFPQSMKCNIAYMTIKCLALVPLIVPQQRKMRKCMIRWAINHWKTGMLGSNKRSRTGQSANIDHEVLLTQANGLYIACCCFRERTLREKRMSSHCFLMLQKFIIHKDNVATVCGLHLARDWQIPTSTVVCNY